MKDLYVQPVDIDEKLSIDQALHEIRVKYREFMDKYKKELIDYVCKSDEICYHEILGIAETIKRFDTAYDNATSDEFEHQIFRLIDRIQTRREIPEYVIANILQIILPRTITGIINEKYDYESYTELCDVIKNYNFIPLHDSNLLYMRLPNWDWIETYNIENNELNSIYVGSFNEIHYSIIHPSNGNIYSLEDTEIIVYDNNGIYLFKIPLKTKHRYISLVKFNSKKYEINDDGDRYVSFDKIYLIAYEYYENHSRIKGDLYEDYGKFIKTIDQKDHSY